jgi:MoaA/NifB/PqqE/SkfB family radical SAM enzyme
MDLGLLKEIVKKAKSECRVMGFELFNWTEPILHPKLPEMIRFVQSEDIKCDLSSNLNTLRNIDDVMAANPFRFRISCSGFRQENYGRTHRGGDIERVKKNMVLLAEAKKRQNATTRIHVLYHRYKHNLKDEPLLRQLAKGLGFEFQTCWAYLMPLEKILAAATGQSNDATISPEDRSLMDSLALPLPQAMEVSKTRREQPCLLQDSKIAIDYQGNVQLCCATYDARKFTIGNYLDLSIDEIQARKYKHEMCGRCAAQGAHVYVTYAAPEFEEIAARNVAPEDAAFLGLDAELRRTKLRRKLEKVYRDHFANFISLEQSARLGEYFDKFQKLVGKRSGSPQRHPETASKQ